MSRAGVVTRDGDTSYRMKVQSFGLRRQTQALHPALSTLRVAFMVGATTSPGVEPVGPMYVEEREDARLSGRWGRAVVSILELTRTLPSATGAAGR
jgi:hypothetical protein